MCFWKTFHNLSRKLEKREANDHIKSKKTEDNRCTFKIQVFSYLPKGWFFRKNCFKILQRSCHLFTACWIRTENHLSRIDIIIFVLKLYHISDDAKLVHCIVLA